MAPVMQFQRESKEDMAVALATVGSAWMNQSDRRHRRFGPKPAPAQPRRGDPDRYRDFGPVKVGVN